MFNAAKLRLQKYQQGTPPVFKSSSKVSFLSMASLLVLVSEMTKDRVFSSTAFTSSGIGSILSFWEYLAYLPTLSFSQSSDDFLFWDQGVPTPRSLGCYWFSCSLAGLAGDEVFSAGMIDRTGHFGF